MAVCEVCGNDYDKPLEITRLGESHVFDCLECAIHALAPECPRCGCRVIGHGVEVDEEIYCCRHCASASGHEGIRDRI